MQTIDVVYRDFKINYNEDDESWYCHIDSNKRWSRQSLKECKKAIDSFLKEETKFKRIDLYQIGNLYENGEKFRKVTLTSITDDRGGWISHNGKREKIYNLKGLVKITPENDALIAEHQSIEGEIKALKEKQNDIISRLEKYSY